MENSNIKNIFLINTDSQIKTFVFSVWNPDDSLKFDYYLLYLKKGTNPTLIKTNNILESLEKSNSRIIKIDKDDELYTFFINSLQNAKSINLRRNRKRKNRPFNDVSHKLKTDRK